MRALLALSTTLAAAGAPLPTGHYEVTELSIRVKPTKAGGEPWDLPNPLPDLGAEVRVNGTRAVCPHGQDALTWRCQPAGRFKLGDDGTLVVAVTDVDIAADDPVGEARIGVPELRAGARLGEPIELAVDGQLDAVSITLKRVPGPGFWTSGRKAIAIILLLGALGLGLNLGYHYLLARVRHRAKAHEDALKPPPEPAPRRCPFCQGLVAHYLAVCPHCKAAV